MKKFRILALFCAAFTLFAVPVSAATLSPAIAELAAEEISVKAGLYRCDVVFSEEDFYQQTGVNRFPSLTFTSVPPAEDGVLTVADTVIQSGMTVSRELLSKLRFTAASDQVDSTSFTYTLPERYGASELTCKIVFLEEINDAPTVALPTSAETLTTYRNVTLHSCLTASDPEGDELTFRVIRAPKHGTLELPPNGNGTFTYVPDKNYTGKDSFIFTVRDEYGNYSKNCTVTLRTTKNKTGMTFEDMSDSAAYNAAITCASLGLMSPTRVGEKNYFEPNGTVTRIELLASLMDAAGVKLTEAKTEIFADSAVIPEKYQPYAATAVKLGYIQGYAENGMIFFRPEQAVTRAEAAMIASNVLGGQNIAIQTFADSEAVPSWAENAVRFAVANRLLLPVSGDILPESAMTRADSAVMLAAAHAFSD